jgi:hypothetical protein
LDELPPRHGRVWDRAPKFPERASEEIAEIEK